MSTTSTVIGLASGAFTLSAGAAVEPPDGPWWWVAIVALASFIGLVFRWMMTKHDALTMRQEAMHTQNMERALAREERLHKRADDQAVLSQTQVITLQKIADRLDAHSEGLEHLPDRVADKIGCRKPPMA